MRAIVDVPPDDQDGANNRTLQEDQSMADKQCPICGETRFDQYECPACGHPYPDDDDDDEPRR